MNKSEAGKLGAIAKWGKWKEKTFKNIPLETLFWKHVDKLSKNECWNWKASTGTPGYGNLWNGSKNVTAHRVSWIINYGNIPNKMFVCHKCDNRRCVNPAHLFLGSQLDNMHDMINKNRAKKTPCYGFKNNLTKISFSSITKIRKQYSAGNISQAKVAKKFKVSQAHVCDIIRFKVRIHQ